MYLKAHCGLTKKLLRIMKLSALLLLTACLSAGARSYSQKVTLALKDAPMEKVFAEIKKQTGYSIFYNYRLLEKTVPVSIRLKGVPVDEAMKACLSNQPLDYEIAGKSIVIKQKQPATGTEMQAAPPINVHGRIVNAAGEPVAGASVRVKGSDRATLSDDNGAFELNGIDKNAVLVISAVSIETLEVSVGGRTDLGILQAGIKVSALSNVQVTVNTGYQQLPKERTTGSFEFVNREQLNRTTGTDILSRIKGNATGIFFDTRSTAADQSTLPVYNVLVRGLNTLTPINTAPLIVINDLPYYGDIQNINPNDVENITILRDAAAASIYGAKSANGVIVITTRKSSYNQPVRLSLASNITLTEKPDLFYYPQLSTTDFIDIETRLFNDGFYNSKLGDPTYPPLSPVVELLNKRKLGQISAADSAQQINTLKGLDVRNDFEKYVYRVSVKQQYALNLSGGSNAFRYMVSGGLDKNLDNLRGNDMRRITLRSDNIFTPLKNFEAQLGLAYSNITQAANSPGGYGSSAYSYGASHSQNLYPYARLADASGNALPVVHDYRQGYVDTAGAGKLLDWNYRPLDELKNADNTSKQNDLLVNLRGTYKITRFLNLQVNYQYEKTFSLVSKLYRRETYYARNYINLFSQIQGSTVKYIIPNAGILNKSTDETNTQQGRGQLNFSHSWGRHQVNAMAGGDISDRLITGFAAMIYGFDQYYTSLPVDLVNSYPQYGGRGATRITGPGNPYRRTDRLVDYYGNAAYTYNNTYTLSASARKDASNLIGVNTNNKWKPFWTLGAAWTVSNESFFKVQWMSYLKLRASLGYLGNVINTLSPYPIISYGSGSSYFNQTYANVSTPGNPGLSWETMRTFNAGIDFRLLADRINVSADFYSKVSDNIILGSNIDATTGVESVMRNSAALEGRGIDLSVNSLNIKGAVEWVTEFGLSTVHNKVAKTLQSTQFLRASGVVNSGNAIISRAGYSPYGIFSYRFAGLDPATGDPLGYLGKTVSKDYLAMANQLFDTSNLVYHGSGIPTVFGFFNNTFRYKGVSLTIGITYNLGYYIRRSAISYYNLVNNGMSGADYDRRWRQPGDEKNTTVPSFLYPVSNTQRDDFYRLSTANVLRGDNIRLDYLRLAYALDRQSVRKLPVRRAEFFVSGNNLAILWRANNKKLDPMYSAGSSAGNNYYPQPKTLAMGVKIDL